MSRGVLTVALDFEAGEAVLAKSAWSVRVPIGSLPGWAALYRRLWSRGSETRNSPGPWARFYEGDLRALEAALSRYEQEADSEQD